MFASTLNKGFQMTFANEVSISVQWGYGNYCSARGTNINQNDYSQEARLIPIRESKTAEILIEYQDTAITSIFADLNDSSDDTRVVGYVNADTVAKAIQWASALTQEEAVKTVLLSKKKELDRMLAES